MGDQQLGIEALEPDANDGYVHYALPCAHDREIAELVEALVHDPQPATSLSAEHGLVLVDFAERMATLTRREGSPARLHVGLTAIGLASQIVDDEREVQLVLPLLWKSARVLGLTPENEFKRAAERVGNAKLLTEFVARAPEDRSIEAMGYIEVSDGAGFRYEREW